MGRATRWLKGLFGMNNNKKRDQKENNSSFSCDRNGKRASSFSRSGRDTAGLCVDNPPTIPPNITPAEAAWLRSIYSESGKEQNKHAIAVAAATAAAADAAVAAAQAAVAVVRLTSQGRGTLFNGSREKWAAIKIQTVFRGCLARKALRALKGLVKLQALVRGYLVRKQAYATLNSMEALIRAQTSVRAQRTRRLVLNDDNCPPQFRPRNSVEKFEDSRNVCKMSRHSRRLSASSEINMKEYFEENPKIVEVDTGRPKSSRSRRTKTWWISDSGDDSSSYAQTASSPFPCQNPGGLSIPEQWGFTGEECRFSTAQSTPRFANSCGSNASAMTPARSACMDSYNFRNNISFNENYYPNYMAKTQSFKAKLRSQSAPRQRPEPGSKRRLSLNEMMESRNSLSGVRMQSSCSQAQEVVNFKNAVMGKLGRSSDFVREQESY